MNRLRFMLLAAVFAGLVFIPYASAQNVSIIAGNGQVLCGTKTSLQPLVVQVTDASTGAPVGAGVTVNWQSNGISGLFLATGTNQNTTTTDGSGQSTVFFQLPFSGFAPSFLTPVVQTSVSATATVNNVTGSPVTFTLSQILSGTTGTLTPFVDVQAINLPVGDTLTGAIGTKSSIQIQLFVRGSIGQAPSPIPNAALQLLNYQDPASGPLVACAPDSNAGVEGLNTVLTDANGMVTCTPVFGGQPGVGRFRVTIGGNGLLINSSSAGFWQPLADPINDPGTLPPPQTAWVNNLPINIKATAGAPGSIKIVSPTGGTGAGTAGGSTTLTVEVDNAAGQPLSGSTVNWQVVSPANGATITSTSTSDASGKATATLNFSGNLSAAVQVTATLAADTTKKVNFTITVAPPVNINQFQIISGNNQAATVNAKFDQPLVVQVNSTAGVAANIPVQFQVVGGSLSLSATSVNTDSSGRAQVTVTAGSVTGSAQVQASLATTSGVGSVTFSLTVLPQGISIAATSFVNGADLQSNSLSPCGLGAIVSGSPLGIPSSSPTFPGAPAPSSSVQLSFNNSGAPILGIGTNPFGQQQILFQVPCDLAPGSSIPVTLSVGGGVSNINVAVQAASPGIFTTKMSDGIFRTVLVRPDGSFVSLENPARRGETEIVYITGLGATSTSVGTGSVPAPGGNATVLGSVVVGMNGGGVPFTSAKLSEDLPGIYMVAFQIPADMATGNNISFSVGVTPQGSSTTVYSSTTKIPVQ